MKKTTVILLFLLGGLLVFRSLQNQPLSSKQEALLADNASESFDNSKKNYGGYDNIGDLTNVGGKVAFLASRGEEQFVVYDGSELGKEYDEVYGVREVGGKLVFVGVKNKEAFIVYDGKKIGKGYDFIASITDLGGKIAFITREDEKMFIEVMELPD